MGWEPLKDCSSFSQLARLRTSFKAQLVPIWVLHPLPKHPILLSPLFFPPYMTRRCEVSTAPRLDNTFLSLSSPEILPGNPPQLHCKHQLTSPMQEEIHLQTPLQILHRGTNSQRSEAVSSIDSNPRDHIQPTQT